MVEAAGKWESGAAAVQVGMQATVEMDGEGKPMADKEVTKIQITEQGQFTAPGIQSTKGPDAKPGEPGPYMVRGTVKTNKNGELTVAAANESATQEAFHQGEKVWCGLHPGDIVVVRGD